MHMPLNHLGAPALVGLPRQNVQLHLPIQRHQVPANGQRGALLGGVNTAFQLGQRVGMPGGGGINRLIGLSFIAGLLLCFVLPLLAAQAVVRDTSGAG